MPWTQIKYPLSMKKLPLAVRKKAIEIANALLKKDKKMKEGVVIATAIKNAKALLAKKSKGVKVVAKKKVAVKKAPSKKVAVKTTIKAAPKKKVAAKKVVVTVKKKAKVASVKRAKVVAKAPVKTVVKKKIVAKRKYPKPIDFVTDSFIIEPVVPEVEIHGEDQNFIPEEGDVKPVNAIQVHNFENVFHHREETAMHQENKKVNDAKASRKSYKRTYRMNGNR